MCNLYTYKLSRDEIRGLMEHYKLVGVRWTEALKAYIVAYLSRGTVLLPLAAMRIGLILLALSLVSCALPGYDDPKRVARVAKLRDTRDLCLIQNVPQFDDGASAPAKVGNYVAMSCSVQTTKLVDAAIPYPSQHERNAFQQEAVLLATGYVLTARRIETDAVERPHQQRSQPLP